MTDYARELAAYTRGAGRLSLELDGYDLCHDPEAVRAAHPYDPEADLDNTPDSVFCAHGGGFTVKWDKVFANMHLESVLAPKREAAPVRRRRLTIDEKELQAILEREFGPIRRPQYSASVWKDIPDTEPERPLPERKTTKCLVVDGMNVLHSWPELSPLVQTDLEQAREKLMEILANYAAFTRTETVLVFDAYKVRGGKGERFDYHGVRVVYTKENETADAWIERFLHDVGKNEQVQIVTSDNLIQVSALRSGVLRQSAREFGEEIDRIYGDIDAYLRGLNREKLGNVGENMKTK
jgi:predicted RNA-binding protein with PIN domain